MEKSVKTFALVPDDGHKSFNRKATVKEYTDMNGIEVKELKSYDTVVCVIEIIDDKPRFNRTWSNYSATTLRHVNAFLKLYDCPEAKKHGLSKQSWNSLPVVRNKH